MEKHKLIKFIVSWLEGSLYNITHTLSVRWDEHEIVIAVTIPYAAIEELQQLAEQAAAEMPTAASSDSDMSNVVEPQR